VTLRFRPSKNQFVLMASTQTFVELRERLRDVGTLETLAAAEPITLLTVTNSPGEPRSRWASLVEQFDDIAFLPILIDRQDQPHYPTGHITVRFAKAPSDEELQTLAVKYRLQLRERNKYDPLQASFTPKDLRSVYLPEIISEVSRSDNVSSAWANVRSRHRLV